MDGAWRCEKRRAENSRTFVRKRSRTTDDENSPLYPRMSPSSRAVIQTSRVQTPISTSRKSKLSKSPLSCQNLVSQTLKDYFTAVDAFALEIEVNRPSSQPQTGKSAKLCAQSPLQEKCLKPENSSSSRQMLPELRGDVSSPIAADRRMSSPAPFQSSSGLGVLERLLHAAREHEHAVTASFSELPARHRVVECPRWDEPQLAELMTSFQQEDPRIGASRMSGKISWPNMVHLLVSSENSSLPDMHPAEEDHKQGTGIAIGYVWSQLSAPNHSQVDEHNLPRIHHLYVRRGYRRAHIGRRLLNWWRKHHAMRVEAFAVTDPNAQMRRLLERNGCTRVLQNSGFDGSAEHFHSFSLGE